MFFTKEKKQAPKGKRPAPAGKRQAEPERRKAAPPQDRPRRRPEEAQEQPRRRRPEEVQEQPRRRRPEETQEQPRRRRPEEAQEQPRKRRRPEEAQEQPRRRRPELPREEPRRRPAPPPQQPPMEPLPEQQPELPQPEPVQEGDTVFSMADAPRRNGPAAPEGRPAPRKKKAPRHSAVDNGPAPDITSHSVKNAPQGTSYKRHGARARKNFFERFIPSRIGKDPELMADEARMQMMERSEVEKKKKIRHFDMPAMIYTQPKPFSRARLATQLVTVLAVVAAFVLALSIFFKVEVITISGAETYSPWTVREASGIVEGDNLLTFGRARACGQITAKLPYVESVRIGIKLPNTVNIDIKELDVVYSIKSGDGDWWLITSGGKVVKQINESLAKDYTKILGVAIENPIIGEQAYAVEAPPEGTTPEGETAPVTVSGAMRMSAAMQIVEALENNDIVGDAASVNVENLEKIELWYGQRYQVNLGDAARLEEKVDCMYDVILQLSDYQTGMLDVSFTKKADQVIYTPFV